MSMDQNHIDALGASIARSATNTPPTVEAVNRPSGKVERIEYTHGGAGNQWTTIDGVRYATWWDILSRDWKLGDEVTFDAREAPLWHGMAPVLQAHNIRRIAP